jgi:hypothetical protein
VRDGKTCYYINDGVYHTYSGVIFDHCKYPVRAFKKGPTQICSVFGPTCDALDVVSMAENLPDLERDDFVYSVNIGAYSHASATYFNGFPPATVVHVNSGQTVMLSATASSGLAVHFTLLSGMGSINGGTITAQSGTLVIEADQPGDGTYEAAMPVTQTLQIQAGPGASSTKTWRGQSRPAGRSGSPAA